MERLRELLRKIQELDVDVMMFEIMSDTTLQRTILDYNLEQLKDGRDALGVPLSNYRPYSPSYANFKGSQTVDFFLTGSFYDTFRFVNRLGGFDIEADTMIYKVDFNKVYGGSILGLDRENMTKLQELLLPYIDEYLKQYLK